MTVFACLAGAGAAQASSAGLSLSLEGAGAKTGEAQTLKATVTNTGSDAFTPKACVLWSSTYMTLQGQSTGTSNCYTWPAAMTPGSNGTTSWVFTGKKPGSGSFTVKVYKSGSTTVLTSANQNYTIVPKGPQIKIVTTPENPSLNFSGLPSSGELKATLQNTGDQAISSYKLCLQKPSPLQINYPRYTANGTDYCFDGGNIAAAVGGSPGKTAAIHTFRLSATAIGSGSLSIHATSRSVGDVQSTDARQIPYTVTAPQISMKAGAVKGKGTTRSRTLTFTNQGNDSPVIKACVMVKGGRLISITPRLATTDLTDCADLGAIAPGESTAVKLKVKGKKAKAAIEVSGQELPSQTYYSGQVSFR